MSDVNISDNRNRKYVEGLLFCLYND